MDRYFVLCESNIVLRSDGSLPDFSELEKIKAENPVQEYYEEKNTGIKVLGLVSAENLGSAYKMIALREFFAENAADDGRRGREGVLHGSFRPCDRHVQAGRDAL